MHKNLRNIFRALVLMLILGLGITQSFAQNNAKVRFVHVVPNVGAVDIYINGTLAVESLTYGTASLYLNVPSGDHTVAVTASGQPTPLWEQAFTADAERPTTFIAADGQQFISVNENLNFAVGGNSRLMLVHALAGGPAVDVKLAEAVTLGGSEQPAGTPIASSMAYSTTFGSFDIPAQVYTVDVLVAGDTTKVLSNVSLPLATGTSYLAVVYGTAAQPSALLLTAMMQPDADSGLVRFVHAVIGGPAVDIFDGDTLLVPSIQPEQATEHIGLATGDHTIVFKVAGEDTVVAQADLSVDLASAQTVVATEATGAVVLIINSDNISDALNNPQQAVVSVTNTITESTVDKVTIGGTTVSAAVPFAETSSATTVDAVKGTLDFALTLSGQSGDIKGADQVLYGGTYYNVVAVSGGAFSAPKLLVFPTALTTTLGSAPNASTMTLATQPTPVAVQPTPAPAEVVATQAPTTPSNAITGRVLLDPGANLQLRQNPDADALSLGLAPSGTVLIVNGREGAPVALVEGQQPPAEAADFVDPVGLLPDEKTDLDPTQTWLNVTYNTPDGGQITAWVNAQFLDVRDAKGEKFPLRNLDLVGGNIPGSAESTAITPPPIPEDTLTALVVNLDPGIFLNIRRTSSTDGEVIGKIPVNTTIIFVGMSEDDAWAFIEYTTPEGGIIDGWVTTQYLQYQYNGKKYNLEDFKNIVSKTTSQALFEIIPSDTLGAVQGNVSQIAVPTANPLKDQFVANVSLDNGSNLQLRRFADATSESLNLIPSGTQLIITTRDETSTWLKVTFEGEEGWINAGFVQITFNGKPVTLDEIPVEQAGQ